MLIRGSAVRDVLRACREIQWSVVGWYAAITSQRLHKGLAFKNIPSSCCNVHCEAFSI